MKHYDRFAADFYHSHAWDVCRKAYMKSVNGLCERCLRRGIVTPARVVHHKTRLTPDNLDDPSITLSFGNLEALCQDCHEKEHSQQQTARYTFDKDGNLLPPIEK